MTLRKKKTLENMTKEWAYLDPIFRSFTTQVKWLQQREMFDYIDAKVEDINLKGAIAVVKMSITYKLNAKFATGKLSQVEDIHKDVTMTQWGWFYDNWYLIPDNPKQSYLP